MSLGACARVTAHLGGRLAELRFEDYQARQFRGHLSGGGVRGRVQGFSAASRRRLLRRMASVNRYAARRLPAWVTLTYPDEYPTDWRVHKAHLRALLKRLWRKYGDHAVVWRLEWQRRGAPHYHLVLWDMKVTREFQLFLSEAWYQVVGSGDKQHLAAGTNARQADSWRGLTAYLSKYLAKVSSEADDLTKCEGRIWGVEKRDLLPVQPVSFLVSVREGMAFRRVLSRAAKLPGWRRRDRQGLSAYLSWEAVSAWLNAACENLVIPSTPYACPDGWHDRSILPRPVISRLHAFRFDVEGERWYADGYVS